MHEKLLCINNGGISFLSKFYDTGNAMAHLLLGTSALLTLLKKNCKYKLLKDVSNTKSPLALYIFVMTELVLYNNNKINILRKLFRKYSKRLVIIPCRYSFRTMLNKSHIKIIPQTFICQGKEDGH